MKQESGFEAVAFKIVAVYALIGGGWISLSDFLAHNMFHDRSWLMTISIYKGWVFIIVTSCMLYALMRYSAKRLRRYEDGMHHEQELSRLLLDSLPGPSFLIGRDRRIKAGNSAGRNFGASKGDYCWCGIYALKSISAEQRAVYEEIGAPLSGTKCFYCRADEAMTRNRPLHADVELDGTTWDTWWVPVNQETFLHYAVDVTARKQLEEQLRQSQKMESIGTLAGGLAHDFNNIITVIMASAGMLSMKIGDDAILKKLVDQIMASSDRAATLTQRLLTFSRKQAIQPSMLNINDIVLTMRDFLEQIIGDDVRLETVLSPDPLLVSVDQGQIEQVLMNLAINARDAMPKGGLLRIATSRVDCTEISSEYDGGGYGRYVLVSLTDTGSGMDKATKARIFEPFFTTKESGRGTGLGLSVSYGIIKQHEGVTTVNSEPGNGTTFSIFLPYRQTGPDETAPFA